MKKTLTIIFLLLAGFAAKAQYCIPAPGSDGCTDDDMIDNFVLFGENGTSIINLATGCSPNAYADLTAQSVSLGQGATYTATISTQFMPDDNVAIWIDFNDNTTFETTELVGTALDISITGSPVSIAIPGTAPLGNHRMRVSLRFEILPTDMNPCNNGTIGVDSSDFGEAHDYTVNIVPPPTCPAPTNLVASGMTQNGVNLNWNGTAPQYSIEYGPAGFLPGTGTYTTSMTNSATLNTLNSSTNYDVYVRALCSTTDSSVAITESFATTCGAQNIPYTENFDGVVEPDVPVCMTVEDANADGNTWFTESFLAQSAPNGLIYGSDGFLNANEWIFTPGLNVTAGTTYTVSFSYATEGTMPEALEVKAGTAAASTAMGTTAYFSNTTLQNTNFVTSSFSYTAATTGVIYFGWHLFSTANIGGLVLDDISITTTTTSSCDTSLTLTATAVTSSSANLTWSAVTGATGYQYVLDQTAAIPTGPGTPTTLTTFNATSLTPNTTYYFHVRTACSGSTFSDWKTVSFTTLPASTCDTSLTLAATGVSAYNAILTWSAVTGASGYQYVLDQTAALPTGAGTPTTLTTFAAGSLTPNTTYYFHVRTACAGSTFSDWKTVSFTTAPVSVVDVNGKHTGVQVYPNPVNDIAYVALDEAAEGAQIQLTDVSGKVLQTITVNGTSAQVDMSKVAPGIYIIRYSDRDQQQLIKVVKQ